MQFFRFRWHFLPFLLAPITIFSYVHHFLQSDFNSLPPFPPSPLEVVRYLPGEQFGLHHDASAAFQRRVATLLIYLNGDSDSSSSSSSSSDSDSSSSSSSDSSSSSSSDRASESSSGGGGISGGETYFPFAVGNQGKSSSQQQAGTTPSSSSTSSPLQLPASPPWRVTGADSSSTTTRSPREDLEAALRHAAMPPPAGTTSPRSGNKGRDGEGGVDAESRRGVKVAPQRGKAMLFYNLDWHTGQPDPAVLEKDEQLSRSPNVLYVLYFLNTLFFIVMSDDGVLSLLLSCEEVCISLSLTSPVLIFPSCHWLDTTLVH